MTSKHDLTMHHGVELTHFRSSVFQKNRVGVLIPMAPSSVISLCKTVNINQCSCCLIMVCTRLTQLVVYVDSQDCDLDLDRQDNLSQGQIIFHHGRVLTQFAMLLSYLLCVQTAKTIMLDKLLFACSL